MTFLSDDLRCQTLYHLVKLVVFLSSLFFCKLFYKLLENLGTRVGYGIHRMTHAVNQTSLVKGFFMEQFSEVFGNLLLVLPVLYMFLHIVKHSYNFNVGSAVFRAF